MSICCPISRIIFLHRPSPRTSRSGNFSVLNIHLQSACKTAIYLCGDGSRPCVHGFQLARCLWDLCRERSIANRTRGCTSYLLQQSVTKLISKGIVKIFSQVTWSQPVHLSRLTPHPGPGQGRETCLTVSRDFCSSSLRRLASA